MPLALLLQLAALLAPQAAQPPTTDAIAEVYTLVLQARGLEQGGEIDRAIATYRRALAVVPANADIHAELAGIYARDGRAFESMKEAEAALAIDAGNAEAHRLLGLVQAVLAERTPRPAGDRSLMPEAIGHLEKALAARRDPNVELTLGRLYVRSEQHAKAVTVLRRFVLDHPDYVDGLMLLADAFDGNEQPAEAIATLGDAIREAPGEPRPRARLVELATEYASVPEPARGRDLLQRAAQALPSSSLVQERLGDLHVRLKQYREAAAAFQRALDGDRQSVDAAALAAKRDRARELAGR
jgi:tetratricopeptide (TPR) repeat protein